MSIHVETRQDGRRSHKVRWRDGPVNRARSFDHDADARARPAQRSAHSPTERRYQAGLPLQTVFP